MKNYCKQLLRATGFACIWLFTAIPASSADDFWLLADLDRQRLVLYGGDNREVRSFGNISIGSGGVSQLHLRGDQTTPRGKYRITHINHNSRYRVFIGLNYPTSAHAKYAYVSGKISASELDTLLKAARSNHPPPADTPLGGMIGIHALGEADLRIHKVANWTDGCIALNNEQMDQLLPYVREGMRVVIR